MTVHTGGTCTGLLADPAEPLNVFIHGNTGETGLGLNAQCHMAACHSDDTKNLGLPALGTGLGSLDSTGS